MLSLSNINLNLLLKHIMENNLYNEYIIIKREYIDRIINGFYNEFIYRCVKSFWPLTTSLVIAEHAKNE